jgi:hypothetical protein
MSAITRGDKSEETISFADGIAVSVCGDGFNPIPLKAGRCEPLRYAGPLSPIFAHRVGVDSL